MLAARIQPVLARPHVLLVTLLVGGECNPATGGTLWLPWLGSGRSRLAAECRGPPAARWSGSVAQAAVVRALTTT